jgi:hypothetical protein
MELQAANPRPHITRAKARLSLISAFRRRIASVSCANHQRHGIVGLTPIRARYRMRKGRNQSLRIF